MLPQEVFPCGVDMDEIQNKYFVDFNLKLNYYLIFTIKLLKKINGLLFSLQPNIVHSLIFYGRLK